MLASHWRLLPLLWWALGGLQATAQQQDYNECEGPGSEYYDRPEYIGYPLTAFDNGYQKPCKYFAYSSTWAQLFTPPRIPWKFTRVCVGLSSGLSARNATPVEYDVAGTVSVYPVVISPHGLVPGPRIAYAGFTKRLKNRPAIRLDPNYTDWASIDVSGLDFVAWDTGVFVGVDYWSCSRVLLKMSELTQYEGRLVTVYSSNNEWIPARLSMDPAHAIALRTLGQTAGGVPPGWACAKSKFGDGKCDCNCGASDVDCRKNPTSPDCGPNAVCDHTSRCINCDDMQMRIMNCRLDQVCNYQGKCVAIGCNNHRAEPTEECDGGVGCSPTCSCIRGFKSQPDRWYPHEDCITVDANESEECDGGDGCVLETCRCASGFSAAYPLQTYCRAPGKDNKKKVIIGSTVGSVGGFILIVAVIIGALLYAFVRRLCHAIV
eukprot:m51a1_g4092 putative C-tail anchored protein (433) ;mRNA; r:65848-68283